MFDRRALLSSGALALLGTALAATPVAASAQSGRTIADQQLDEVLRALEGLPEELKTGTSQSVENYESRLREALGGVKTPDPVAVREAAGETPGMQPFFDPIMCPIELAAFVLSVGIPVGRMIQYIRRAREIWGSVRGIWAAIRSGDAAGAIGADGVDLLTELLGSPSVAAACF